MDIKLKYQIKEPFDKGLIQARGIENSLDFINPKSINLQSPLALDNIEDAIIKINAMKNEKTLLIVDSDCDGYCSAAILWQYLGRIYPEWIIDIALHEAKQHGLEDIVEKYDLADYKLVLIPDAGSNDDVYFNDYPQVNFVVLDHHLRTLTAPVPNNVILVNNQMSFEYGNKSLSGAGVVWQLCRAMDQHYGKDFANDYIDLTAVAIIGDVMDTTTLENRYIINKGLDSIQNEFLRILINNASFQLKGGTLTPMNIAFYIVPNINAMCRMGTSEEKERMWWAFIDPSHQVESHKRGVAKGTLVDVTIESMRECTNVKARQKREQEKMAALCDKIIIENDLLQNKILIIELDETFDKIPTELNGLTATKIANETGHPTLIGRVNKKGHLKGSIRGLQTINMPPLKEFLEASGMFNYIQGHSNAAGFNLPISKLDMFHRWANSQLAEIDLNSKTWHVDFIFNAYDEELKYAIQSMDKLKNFWGQGFPEALIAVNDIIFSRADVQVMGKEANTVKVTSEGISYMFFKRSEEEVKHLISFSKAKLNIVGTANVNVYFNKITPQIFVNDYMIMDNLTSF